MNTKVLASFTVFVLLFSVVSSVAFADDKTDLKSKETRQQSVQSKSPANTSDVKNCASNLDLLKKLLDDSSRKASTLREKLYSEWKSKYSSGQIKDGWDVYSKKLETSQEMIAYRQTQEKYNLILASCIDNSQSKPQESRVRFTSSEECVSAQRMIDDIDQRYSILKQKAYDDWKSQNAAGTYAGTWEQYANEFINSSQVSELNQARQKYDPVLRTCYVQSNAKSSDLPQSASTVESQRQSCPDADMERIQTALNDSGQKVSVLKERLYSEWKASYDSGQTRDGWDVYAKKKFEGSQEFATYMQLQKKLDSLYEMCRTNEKPQTADNPKPANPEPRVQFVQSEECISAKKTIDGIDQRYSVLKQKAYDGWRSQNAAGSYAGTWGQYADEKLIKSTGVLELGKMREKYEPFLRTCYVQSGVSSDVSQTKPLLKTSADQKLPAKITQKPLPSVSKTDKKPYGTTDDSGKKWDKSVKLTKAKPDKLIKKPQRQFVQK